MFILKHLDIILGELVMGYILWMMAVGVYDHFSVYRRYKKNKIDLDSKKKKEAQQ